MAESGDGPKANTSGNAASGMHRNPFRGFGAPGGQNLAFPITLASRFYNSLYYRTSRDSSNLQIQTQPAANGAALSALEDIIIYNLKKIKALLHKVEI